MHKTPSVTWSDAIRIALTFIRDHPDQKVKVIQNHVESVLQRPHGTGGTLLHLVKADMLTRKADPQPNAPGRQGYLYRITPQGIEEIARREEAIQKHPMHIQAPGDIARLDLRLEKEAVRIIQGKTYIHMDYATAKYLKKLLTLHLPRMK